MVRAGKGYREPVRLKRLGASGNDGVMIILPILYLHVGRSMRLRAGIRLRSLADTQPLLCARIRHFDPGEIYLPPFHFPGLNVHGEVQRNLGGVRSLTYHWQVERQL